MVRYGNNTMEDAGMRRYAQLQGEAGERHSYSGPGKSYAERAHMIPSPRKPYELPIDDRTTGLYGKRMQSYEDRQARDQIIRKQLYDGTYSMN